MRAALLFILAIGCNSTPRDTHPANVSSSSTLRVSATDPLGTIGLATYPSHGVADHAFIPISAEHTLVVPGETTIKPGDPVTALGLTGEPTRYTALAPTKILFGCDGNMLDVTPLRGPRLPPGPAWILPTPLPAGWSPAPLAIRRTSAAPASSRYTIGPLTLDLVRHAPLRGSLTITREGRTVHAKKFERQLMDGAPPEMRTIDLSSSGPGIPLPVGAWTIAPNGPVLLALLQPGWEGATIEALLVETASTQPVEAMSLYLYSCAF